MLLWSGSGGDVAGLREHVTKVQLEQLPQPSESSPPINTESLLCSEAVEAGCMGVLHYGAGIIQALAQYCFPEEIPCSQQQGS
jgi:hypothetical protein